MEGIFCAGYQKIIPQNLLISKIFRQKNFEKKKDVKTIQYKK